MITPQYMATSYNMWLVALSVGVAFIAAYAALDLSDRVHAVERWHRWVWLTAGALAMGSGIWSMHFIGMLTLQMPIPLGYAISLTFFSWAMAVIASVGALYLASQPTLRWWSWLGGATFMAIAIVGMHYTGMYAMKIEPGIAYAPW